MSMPYRPMNPWWHHIPVHQQPAATFRQPHPGAQWTQEWGDDPDPRLGPAGDVARRGTIPKYTTYAVVNPRRRGPVPQ